MVCPHVAGFPPADYFILKFVLCFFTIFSNQKFISMLIATLIGNLGANAEIKTADGREFVTFRVAHNDSYKGADGNKVESSMWIDCTMSCASGRPAVLPYLTKGTAVCVVGQLSTRIYSSEKDRCMKAGVKIHVQRVELIGGAADNCPRRLYSSSGEMLDVNKYFHVETTEKTLYDQRGNAYQIAEGGWVTPPNVQGNE